MMADVVRIAAAVLLRGDRFLAVRKRGTGRFMLPGGKFEPGETALDCVVREVEEELGVRIDAARPLGRFEAPAANEPDVTVVADIFVLDAPQGIEPRAEIEDARWLPLSGECPEPLAPLLETKVLPAVRALA